MTFDPDQLGRAIRLQQKAFNLLKWLKARVNKDVVTVQRAHDVLDSASAARYWIEVTLPSIPRTARPDPDEIDGVANLFASYLTTSFELTETPGSARVTECGCYCSICSYWGRAPYLKARKTTDRDKRKAQELMADTVQELAWAGGRELDRAELAKVASDQSLRRDLALVTYARHLMRRLQGGAGSPALLVVWRAFAWKAGGGRDREFALTAEIILTAESRLMELIRAA